MKIVSCEYCEFSINKFRNLINTTLTRSKCTFYPFFPTLAALDSKRILSGGVGITSHVSQVHQNVPSDHSFI